MQTRRPFAESKAMLQLQQMMNSISAEPNNTAVGNPSFSLSAKTPAEDFKKAPEGDSEESSDIDQGLVSATEFDVLSEEGTDAQALADVGDLREDRSNTSGIVRTITPNDELTFIADSTESEPEPSVNNAEQDLSVIAQASAAVPSDEEEVLGEKGVAEPSPVKPGFVSRWIKRAVSWVKRMISYVWKP